MFFILFPVVPELDPLLLGGLLFRCCSSCCGLRPPACSAPLRCCAQLVIHLPPEKASTVSDFVYFPVLSVYLLGVRRSEKRHINKDLNLNVKRFRKLPQDNEVPQLM